MTEIFLGEISKYQKAPVHHLLDMCTKFRKYILRGFVVKLRKRNVTDGRTDGTHFYIPRQLRWLAGDNKISIQHRNILQVFKVNFDSLILKKYIKQMGPF